MPQITHNRMDLSEACAGTFLCGHFFVDCEQSSPQSIFWRQQKDPNEAGRLREKVSFDQRMPDARPAPLSLNEQSFGHEVP